MEIIISIKNVSKKFKEQVVLDNISMELKKGEIYGLIGRNGSGKTVLLKCICGFMHQDEGEIFVQGKQMGKEIDIAEDVGAIIEHPGFLLNLSGMKNLKMLLGIRGKTDKEKAAKYMEMVGLDSTSRKPVGKYSLGMRQRLGIAQAIMEEPKILILDEPMNGLDNEGVRDMRILFKKLNENGTTIILASHNQLDIQMLCKKVYEMDKGRIINIYEANVTC